MRSILMTAGAAMLAASPAAARWREAESQHFVVYAEMAPESLRAVATKLERYDAAMRFVFGIQSEPPSQATRLTVFVVRNIGQVQKLAGQNGKTVPRIAGFYQASAVQSVAVAPTPSTAGEFELSGQTVLLHEYAHHVMLGSFSAAYPGWYVEGFAELCSTARFDMDGTVGFGLPALHRAYGLLRGERLTAEVLFGEQARKMTPDERESLYGRGWLLTHYLTFEKKRDGQLMRYLKALNAGKPSLAAAHDAFGDLAVLDRELDRYLNARLQYVKIPAEKLKIGAIEVHELSNGEDAILPIRIRSQRGVNDKAAAAVLQDARRLAAPYPDDPAVQLAMAEAEYDAGNDAEADAAAERALAARPSSRAWLYRAMVALRRASKAKGKAEHLDPAAAKPARDFIVKANRADPDDPLPLVYYHGSFAAVGARPTETAVAGLERAFELVPQDMGLRFMLAHQRAQGDDLKTVRLLLAPMAFDPHGGGSYPAEIVRLIDAGRADDAKRLLDHPESFKRTAAAAG